MLKNKIPLKEKFLNNHRVIKEKNKDDLLILKE